MDSYTLPSEPQRKRIPFHWPAAWTALAMHTLSIVAFACVLYPELRSDPETIEIWILWCLFDFPSGIFALLFARFVTGNFHPHDDVTSNIAFAIHFGLFGGLQWFLVCGIWGKKQTSQSKSANQSEPNVSSTEHFTPVPLDNPYSAPQAQPNQH